MLHLLCTLQTAGYQLAERRRKADTGQTAAEYLGIVVVIGAIIGVLATTDIGNTLKTAITAAIGKVASGNGK